MPLETTEASLFANLAMNKDVGVPISMVQNPMILIGEDHKSTRNTEPG